MATNPSAIPAPALPLVVGQGGTGATTAAGALATLGAAPLSQVPWTPADNGLLTANGDPYMSGVAVILTAGTLYLFKLPVRSALTITNLVFDMTTAGAGASTGSFAGLYSAAGTLLSGSADIGATLIGSTGPITLTLTTPQAVAGGVQSAWPWAALLVNLATTQPTMARATPNSGVANFNLATVNFRATTNGTGLVALPGSITPASNTNASGTTVAALVGAT